MAETRILVSPERFNVGTEYSWLAERDEDGAVVTFTGKVRNHNLGEDRRNGACGLGSDDAVDGDHAAIGGDGISRVSFGMSGGHI